MSEPTPSRFEKPVAGVLVPLFALRGKDDLGCGDTGALREFIAWAADRGFGVVQLLPVNETGSDNSPYNAISSVAIEPATIDLARVTDLQPAEIEEVAGHYKEGELREGPVKWQGVKALKSELLRRAFANFGECSSERNDSRAREFAEFVRAESAWLDGYVLFRLLMETYGTERWDKWPVAVRSLGEARGWLASLREARRAELEQHIRFFQYVQWQAFSQWREVKAFADERGVLLMGDVPFGVNYYSADVWAEPELFDLRWSGGAPPEPAFLDDEFIQKWGQNWGVPLYCWPVHRATRFAWWRRRVRKIEEAFHVFRIDHVLGFYRIYGFPWRPERNAEFLPLGKDEARQRVGGELPRFHERADDTPENCAANRAQGEEFLRVLQTEVGPGALVGEDLGVVPDYVRPSLLSLKIPGFKVPLWEAESDLRLTPGERYERCSVATFATHDHEPLRVAWEQWMSAIRAALQDPERLGAARDFAWREARRLAEWAGFDVPSIMAFEEVHERLLAGLFTCNAWLTVVMITDLLGTSQRFNVPGSVGNGNWSARLPAGWQSAFEAQSWKIARLLRLSGR
jgi:4-alpha-glucanotransferase